jgi:hypothetical protein
MCTSAAMSLFSFPAAAASTIMARVTSRAGLLRPRLRTRPVGYRVSILRSSKISHQTLVYDDNALQVQGSVAKSMKLVASRA